jgi:hypothetical protein
MVCKEVAPKRALLAEAQGQLDQVMIELNSKRFFLLNTELATYIEKFTPSKEICTTHLFFVFFFGG